MVAVLVCGAAVFVMRKPLALLAPTIWGEDGGIFWAEALTPGPDLFSPYAAQWWLSQRILFSLLVHLPVSAMPILIYLAACAVAVLAVAVILQHRAQALFGTLGNQVLAFALLILLPTVTEIQGNQANLQVWLAMGLLVLLVLPAPVSAGGKALELLYVVVACLTGIVGVIVAPVAVWAVVRERSRYVWWRSGFVLLCAVVNVAVWASQDRPPSGDLLERVESIPGGLMKRWGGAMILGHHLMRLVWPRGSRQRMGDPGAVHDRLVAGSGVGRSPRTVRSLAGFRTPVDGAGHHLSGGRICNRPLLGAVPHQRVAVLRARGRRRDVGAGSGAQRRACAVGSNGGTAGLLGRLCYRGLPQGSFRGGSTKRPAGLRALS